MPWCASEVKRKFAIIYICGKLPKNDLETVSADLHMNHRLCTRRCCPIPGEDLLISCNSGWQYGVGWTHFRIRYISCRTTTS
ncbi:hypothetical protein Y032_0036g3318 [Ancylostoma ceylanicum]|uniref:Uncharacterized protein n=1 Tax=Ancylostoma ceylanicum TaxID=53326 RepID=A0A016UK12_9BILA|nr:hypothetical protein Y032_0036g3318 [Ancylostoma ceylanicum]